MLESLFNKVAGLKFFTTIMSKKALNSKSFRKFVFAISSSLSYSMEFSFVSDHCKMGYTVQSVL